MRGYLPAALLSAKLVSGFVIGDLNACPDAIAECSAVDSQPSSVAASLECLQALQVDLSAFTPGPCLDALNLYYQASADGDESADSSLEIGQSDSNPRGRRPPRGFFIDGFFGESPRPNKYKFHPKADKEDEDDDDDDDNDDDDRKGRDKSRDGRDKSRDGRDKSRGGRDKSRDRDDKSGKPMGDRDVKRGDRKDDSRDRGDEGRRERGHGDYDRDTDSDADDARPAFRNGETRRRPPFPPRGPRPPFPPTGSFEDDGSFEGDDEARPRPPFPRFFEGADATRPRPPFPRDFAPRMPSDDSSFGPGSEANNGETRPPRGPFGKRDHKAWDSDDAPEGFDKADKRDPRAIEWRFADPDQKPRGRKPDFFAFVSSQAPPKPFQFAPEPEPEMPALELIVEEAGYDYDYEYTEPAQPVEIASSDMN